MYKERETIVSGRYNSVTVAAACTANCQKLLDYVNNFYVSWLKGLVGCNFFNDRVNLRASQKLLHEYLSPLSVFEMHAYRHHAQKELNNMSG